MLNTEPDFSSRKTWRQTNAMNFLLLTGLILMSMCNANANEVVSKPPMPEIQPVQVPLKIDPARKVMELDLAKPAKPETPPPAQAAPGPEPVVAPAVPEITKQAKPGKQQDAPSSQAPQLAPNLVVPKSAEATSEDAEQLVVSHEKVREILLHAQQIKIDLQFKPCDTELIVPTFKKNQTITDMLFGADAVNKQNDQTMAPAQNVNNKQVVKSVAPDRKRVKTKTVQQPVVQQRGREQNLKETGEADENREWETIYDIRLPPME
jgi:hypothetical protein